MAGNTPTFDEDFNFVFAKSGKAKAPRGATTGRPAGGSGSRASSGTPGGKRSAVMAAIARKPQVMVKITSFGKNAAKVGDHLDYVSRKGEIEVFDARGESLTQIAEDQQLERRLALMKYAEELGAQDAAPARADKKTGRPRDRVTMNMMLSMPEGTDTGAFEVAVRDFLSTQFDTHEHVFAFHDDRAHYHAHVVVKLEGLDGKWLNPRKADIQEWRENFAASLERNGIAAQATPTYSRGRGKGGYRRDLKETGERGTRRRPERSPTFDGEVEGRAIQRRAEAWTRLAGHYAQAGDQEAAAAIRDYVADRYDHRPEAPAPKAPEPTVAPTAPRPPRQPRTRDRDHDRER